MSLFLISMVSALSIENVASTYNRRTNIVTVDYDMVMNQECDVPISIHIDNKKGKSIVKEDGIDGGIRICQICWRGRCEWIVPPLTGTFHETREFDLGQRRYGRLFYEILDFGGENVLAEGNVERIRPRRKTRRVPNK